ncbi:MAG: hypothetical protein AAGB48_09240 [Planctomycetota bacterium]
MLAEWSRALEELGPAEVVRLKFDGRVLGVSAGELEIEVVASGEPWKEIYSIARRDIGRLPKRPVGDPVHIRVSADGLRIGNQVCGKFKSVREQEISEACDCESEAGTAIRALRCGPTLHTFQDGSHFTAEITSCLRCGRPALELWHEQVNFDGGEDDQTTGIFLLAHDELRALLKIKDWRDGLRLLPNRPMLWEIWPDHWKRPGPRWLMSSEHGMAYFLKYDG